MPHTNNSKPATTNHQAGQLFVPPSDYPRIVVIGGGFAGMALAKQLRRQPVQVVLLDRNNFHQFQPLLYQVATSGLDPESIVFPFRKQFQGYPNLFFRMADVQEVQPAQKRVITDRGALSYDYLVLATGTKTNFFGMQTIESNGLCLKTIQDALDIRHRMLANLETAIETTAPDKRRSLMTFVVVGGGPAGVEMAGSIAEFKRYILAKDYPELDPDMMQVFLIEASGRILSAMSEEATQKGMRHLHQLGVNVLLNEAVTDYDGETVTMKSGRAIRTHNFIWSAGVTGQLPKGISPDQVVRGNRLRVNPFLQVEGMPDVFAIGDIAGLSSEAFPRGLPQVAQVAIQQGRYLGKVLPQIIRGETIAKKFVYKDKGALATVGKKRAIADIGKWKFSGYLAWLIWSVVHLMSISGFRNKVLVGLSWLFSYFSYEKSNRLIIYDPCAYQSDFSSHQAARPRRKDA